MLKWVVLVSMLGGCVCLLLIVSKPAPIMAGNLPSFRGSSYQSAGGFPDDRDQREAVRVNYPFAEAEAFPGSKFEPRSWDGDRDFERNPDYDFRLEAQWIEPAKQLEKEGIRVVPASEMVRAWHDLDKLLALANPRPVWYHNEVIGVSLEHPDRSPLLRATGFQSGDIITKLNGISVTGLDDATEAIEKALDPVIEVSFIRDNKLQTALITNSNKAFRPPHQN